MSKVYSIAFRMGVLFNILLWTILNVVSFVNVRNSHDGLENLGFGVFHAAWGFPIPMFSYPDFFMYIKYLFINAFVYVFCGFVFGFLFKFVWSKISSRRIEVK
jgi:hypothetical protein